MTILLFRGLASVPAAGTFPVVAIEAEFLPSAWTGIDAYADFSGGSQATIMRGANRVESPVVRYEAGTCSIPLGNADRRFDPTNLAGPYVSGGKTLIVPRVPFRVSATYASQMYRLFNGTADAWTIGYSQPSDSVARLDGTDAFKILGVQARKAKTSYLGGGEDSGTRVNRILDDCGWPAFKRSVTVPGSATLQPSLLGGTPPGVIPSADQTAGGATPLPVQASTSTSTPLDELQLTAETEIGQLYVDGNGFLVFRSRSAFFVSDRTRTTQATFGDDPAVPTTELAYADVTVAYDDSTLWNGAVIANKGGTTQIFADNASQAAYGPVVYDQESLIADSDWQASNYAQFIVNSSAQPELRFSQLTVDPVADPVNLFPQVLGRQLGDRITVVRRPPGWQFLTGQNATFDGGIGTWDSPSNCAVAPVTSPVHSGNGAMSMTSAAAGDMLAGHCATANILAQGFPVTPGGVVYTGAWFRAATSGRNCCTGANFYDAAGAFISTVMGPNTPDVTTGYTFVAGTVTAPAGAAFAKLETEARATGAGGEVHYVDDPVIGTAPIIRDVLIRGIQHQFTDSAWLTTWTLQDATSLPPVFIIGDATNGVIGVSKIGY